MSASGLPVRGVEPERDRRPADWIGDAPPAQGLRLYLDLLRSRLGLIALTVVVTVGAAAVFVAQSDKVYEAEADLLVTPIPGDNANLYGLGLVSTSGDPTRDSETLAQLITTPAVAERARGRLGSERSVNELLDSVVAEPVAQSSIVTVTAKASDADSAARLANAFAGAAIEVRTERMRIVLNDLIPRLRAQLDKLPAAEVQSRDALSSRLRELESLRLLPDPTLHLETRAAPPSAAVAPRPVLTVGAAFIAALVLAFAAVFGAHVLDPRIEREDDLRRYRIPVVGRIPREARRVRRHGPLRPDELSPAGVDAFSRLASSLAASTDESEATLMISGVGPGDGKTTTSMNVAGALASLGDNVVLVEADSRRPMLAATLGHVPEHDLADVIAGRVPLARALFTADALGPRVQLLAEEPGETAPALVSAASADKLVRDAQAQGTWLVVDGPALNYAPEALPIAKRVATVLLVVRLRRTRARDLEDLAELLTHQRITPDGFIVIGSKPRAVYR